MNTIIKKMIAIGTLCSLLVCCSSCKTNDPISTSDSANNTPLVIDQEDETITFPVDSPLLESYADVSFQLLQYNVKPDENIFLSPLSVMTAMTMTGLGADNATKKQMEEVFFSGHDMQEMADALSCLLASLPDSESSYLKRADSIWCNKREDVHLEERFLSENKERFEAIVETREFDDHVRKEINQWIEEKTDGMITDMLLEMDPDVVMYLIDALAFVGDWQIPYIETDIQKATFTQGDGTKRERDMMYSREDLYLEDERTTGFIKPYKDGYRFVALLPKEEIAIEDYLTDFSGEDWRNLYQNASSQKVDTAMPKFSMDASLLLNHSLQEMGMTDAFDEEHANFSNMGTATQGNLYIGRVLHNTHIDVNEQGTEAGAATVVEMVAETAFFDESEIKEVILDRPFIYAIVDEATGSILFLGVMNR